MAHAIQDQLAALGEEVRSAAVPDASKQTALWCVDRLPALYDKFGQSYESRYGEEISRLVRGALSELVSSETANAATQQLAERMTARLQALHDEAGIPGLNFKSARPTPPARKSKAR